MTNVACRAALCYNEGAKIVVLGGAVNAPSRIHSWRNVPMDTLPPHADHGNTPLKCCPRCPKDNQWHPATSEFFNRQKSSKDGLKSWCKQCQAKYRATYYAEHREVEAQHMAIYGAEHREELRQYSAQYRKTERGRMSIKVWNHNRKAFKKHAAGSHTAQELQEQFHRQRGHCYYCKVDLGKIWHGDHIIPLSKGGSNFIDNIVIACPKCNQSKYNKLLHEWKEGGRLL